MVDKCVLLIGLDVPLSFAEEKEPDQRKDARIGGARASLQQGEASNMKSIQICV
jgi:hypothetical protein